MWHSSNLQPFYDTPKVACIAASILGLWVVEERRQRLIRTVMGERDYSWSHIPDPGYIPATIFYPNYCQLSSGCMTQYYWWIFSGNRNIWCPNGHLFYLVFQIPHGSEPPPGFFCTSYREAVNRFQVAEKHRPHKTSCAPFQWDRVPGGTLIFLQTHIFIHPIPRPKKPFWWTSKDLQVFSQTVLIPVFCKTGSAFPRPLGFPITYGRALVLNRYGTHYTHYTVPTILYSPPLVATLVLLSFVHNWHKASGIVLCNFTIICIFLLPILHVAQIGLHLVESVVQNGFFFLSAIKVSEEGKAIPKGLSCPLTTLVPLNALVTTSTFLLISSALVSQ